MIVEREIQHGEYLYSVTFSTGVDAFFYSEEAASLLGNSVEIVEVSLDRLQGEGVDQPDIQPRRASEAHLRGEGNRQIFL